MYSVAETSVSLGKHARRQRGCRGIRRGGRPRRPRYGTEDDQARWFGGQRFTGAARWSRDWRKSYWWTDYVEHPAVNEAGTFLYDEFRATFRIPKPMFDDMLQNMRDSGEFTDTPGHHGVGRRGVGRPPAPLTLKLMAALRLLAIGCPVGAAGDMCGLSRACIQEFFPRSINSVKWGWALL